MVKSDKVDEKGIIETKFESVSSVSAPTIESESKPSNKWMLATYILTVVCLILIVLLVSDKIGLTGNVVSEGDMKSRITSFLNNELLPDGGAELTDLTRESGIYVATITANGQEVPLYFTYDGNFISPGRELYKLESLDVSSNDTQVSTPKNITKSDKPIVELFVMTYCPYGTQAEKGILPVINLLKDKANIKIRFVHYFMHGDQEEKETYAQVCIREEQSAKFNSYLSCFLEAGNSTECLSKAGVDKISLATCIEKNAKLYYDIDSKASKEYGVQGSPTLVINGVQADFYPRSPANALLTICSAFTENKIPSACNTSTLSTENPSPGFGSGTTTASTDASCS